MLFLGNLKSNRFQHFIFSLWKTIWRFWTFGDAAIVKARILDIASIGVPFCSIHSRKFWRFDLFFEQEYLFAYHLKRFLVKYFNYSCAPNWKLYQEMNNTHWDKEVFIKLTLVSIVETTNGAENIASTIIQHTITVKIYNMHCSHLNVKCLFLPYIFIIMPRSI